MTAAEPGDDLVQLQLSQILRRRQVGPLTPPMAQEDWLPCGQLAPPVFERLTVEYLLATENPRSPAIYGKSGHTQYGLDIVGIARMSGEVFVAQCRRIESIGPAAVRKAVVDYAGQPTTIDPTAVEKRRFGAKRFLLVTAALVWDKPAIIEEVLKLNEEYAGDLIIELHGAELISTGLRHSTAIVAGVFGPEWARAYCGGEPPTPPVGQATWFGLLEGPLHALELEEADNAVTRLSSTNPVTSADMDLQIADEIGRAGYPGHATAHRQRAAQALWHAGECERAFELEWAICFAGVDQGERIESSLRELAARREQLNATQLARVAVMEAVLDWDGQGSRLDEVVPALEQLVRVRDEYASQLTCLVLEQAVVDDIFNDTLGSPLVGDEVPRDLPQWRGTLKQVAEEVLSVTSQPIWRVRLRCALADASISILPTPAVVDIERTYDTLHRDTRSGRINPKYGFLAFTRSARAHAVYGHKAPALADYRTAVSLALQAGLGGDVRRISLDMACVGQLGGDLGMYGIAWVAKALPNNDRLIEVNSNRRLSVLEWVRAGIRIGKYVRIAFTDARRCLWVARISGNIADELWAWDVFADVLYAAKRPTGEVRARVMAGKGKDAANVARNCPDLINVDSALRNGSPWAVPAAADVIAAQANLIPDSDIGEMVERLLLLAKDAGGTRRVGRPPALAAIDALCALAHRVSDQQIGQLISLLRPNLQRWTSVSDEATEIVGQLYQWNPNREQELAELLSRAIALPYPTGAWAQIQKCRRSGDQLERLAIESAGAGNEIAAYVLASWGVVTPPVARAARRAATRVLQWKTGDHRTGFGSDWQLARTATLIAAIVGNSNVSEADVAHALCVDIPELTDTASAELLEVSAGPANGLAAALFEKLILIAEDSHYASDQRANAIEGMEMLLPSIPPARATGIIGRLLVLSDEPRFGPQDDPEVHGLDPLQGFTMDMGGRTLPTLALRAAAHAYDTASAAEPSLTSADIAADIALRAAIQMRSDDDKACLLAADAAIFVSGHTAFELGILASHRLSSVRAKTIHAWKRSDSSWQSLPRHLASDPSPSVRRAVAFELVDVRQRNAEYETVAGKLANDPSFAVRHTAQRFLD